MMYTSTICAPCRQFSGPLFGTNHSQMVRRVGVGANHFRWGQLEYLEHCVLRGVCTASTLSFSMFCLFYPERQQTFILGGYILYVELWMLPSRSQSIKSKPRPRATLWTYIYAASIELIVASHVFRINIPLPVYPLPYFCSSKTYANGNAKFKSFFSNIWL